MKLACAALLGTLAACSSPAQPSARSSTAPQPIANRSGSGTGSGSDAPGEVKVIPHRKMRLAVLGFEVVVSPAMSPTGPTVAKDFTEALRREAREDHDVTAVIGSRELTDEKLVNNCDEEKPGCMAAIGKNLGADQILFGNVEVRGPVHFVIAKLVDVETKIEVQWTGTINGQAADIQAGAHTAYVTLVGQVQ